MEKKYLPFTIVLLLLVSLTSISAFEFDNVKSYNLETRTATIKNSFLGIPTSTIAEVTLNTPQIYYVYPGGDVKVAEYTINNFDDYNNVFGEMEFYNLITLKEISKDFTYKYKEGNTWKEFDEKIQLPKGIIIIGIFTDVSEGERVEWIPTLFGKRISEWAVFIGSERFEFYIDIPSTERLVIRDNNWVAQTFNPGTVGPNNNFNLTGISLYINKTDGPGAVTDFSIAIADVNSTNGPDYSSLLGVNNTFDIETWGDADIQWFNITFDPQIEINLSKNYSIIMNQSAGSGTNDVVASRYNTTFNPYTIAGGGRAWISSTSGNTWDKGGSNRSMVFMVWGVKSLDSETILISPTNSSTIPQSSINFTVNQTATFGFDLKNVTYKIWRDDNTLFNETTIIITGVENQTILQIDNFLIDGYIWNALTCTEDISSTDCFFDTENFTFSVDANFTDLSFNLSTFETALETFKINTTIPSTSTFSSANFIYNGTSFVATSELVASNKYQLSRTISIPLGTPRNQTHFFNVILDSGHSNSTITNQSVTDTNLSICGGEGGNTPYINFTFKDEETLANLNASADLAEWNYWLGDGSVIKSLLFTNTSENLNYQFCNIPLDRTIHNNLTFQYSSTGYPQRIHVRGSDLTNTTTTQVLYLLSTTDGIYSTIQTVEIVGTVVSGVVVRVERQFSGVWTLIGQDTTDSSGLVTFWVNPDYNHRFTFTKAGFSVITTTLRPTQTTYTQIMSSGTNATYSGNLEGMRWTFSPRGGITSTGGTTFYWNITASLENIVSCRFELVNSTRDVLNSTTTGCTSGGGNLSLDYNLTENLKLWGRGFVDVGSGLFLVDGDAYWRGHNTSVSSTETLKYFFENLKNLNEFGEGVEQEFSRIVFFFLVLTILLGALTFTTGWDMQNPGAIIILLYPIILFASVAGWFTFDGLIKPSILVGEVGAAFLDQYIFAFITSLFTFGYILNYISRNS